MNAYNPAERRFAQTGRRRCKTALHAPRYVAPKHKPRPSLRALARKVCRLHRQNAGSTCSLRFGNAVGLPLYAVAISEQHPVSGRNLDETTLAAYLYSHLRLLRGRARVLGTWYDGRSTTYLDVCCLLSDLSEAIELGRKHGQQAIYDLAKGQAILIHPPIHD